MTAVARPEFRRLRSELGDWPIVEHARVNRCDRRSDASQGEPQYAMEASLCACKLGGRIAEDED